MEVIITMATIYGMVKFDGLVSKIRSIKLRYALSFLMYTVALGFSIYFRMKVLTIICIMVILGNILEIIWYMRLRKIRAKELEEEQRKQDEKDGVAYTLKESEYRELN